MTLLADDQVNTASDLTLSSRAIGDAVVITARGEIDMASAPALHELLINAIDGGCRQLILSMLEVTFMGAAGLSVFVAAGKHMRDQQGSFRIVGLAPGPSKVVQITGLSDVFPAWGTVEDALTRVDRQTRASVPRPPDPTLPKPDPDPRPPRPGRCGAGPFTDQSPLLPGLALPPTL
jgi:anti-anti-sigma factor